MSYCYDAEYCVMCGRIIPEGKQVCNDCSYRVELLYAEKTSRNKKQKSNGEKITVDHIGFKRAILVALATSVLFTGCAATSIEHITPMSEETRDVVRTYPEKLVETTNVVEEKQIVEKEAIEENNDVIAEAISTAIEPIDKALVLPEYHQEWEAFITLNEPTVRFIKAAISEVGKDAETYLRWMYGEDYNEHVAEENWGPAFISWAGENGYGFVTSGLFPKTMNAQSFYEYMTTVSWCRSYVFRSAVPFAKITAIYCGDLVYPVDTSGRCCDVGLVTEVTDNSVTVIYGGGEGVRYETYTSDDFLSEESPMWNSLLQHIEYKRNSRICLDFLMNECNLNWAAALGIMANLSVESDFSPVWAGDNYTSFGICQWNGPRWICLADFCNEREYDMTYLRAQLEFLKYELEGAESNLYDTLLYHIPNTRDGCALAAKIFCIDFENPQDAEIRAAERSENAKEAFWDHYSPIE